MCVCVCVCVCVCARARAHAQRSSRSKQEFHFSIETFCCWSVQGNNLGWLNPVLVHLHAACIQCTVHTDLKHDFIALHLFLTKIRCRLSTAFMLERRSCKLNISTGQEIPCFVEPESCLLCSRLSAISACPEPIKAYQHSHIIFLYDNIPDYQIS